MAPRPMRSGAKTPRKPDKTASMRILVPVDGSPASSAAVHFVAARLTLSGEPAARVELLNVQPTLSLHAARAAGGSRVRAHHDAQASRVLAPAARILRTAGIDAHARSLVGSPGVMLGKTAQREADLVVMGSHGQSSIATLLLGSVTSTVLATSDVPVLIVRAAPRFAPLSRRPLRIGIAVDGARDSIAAVRFLLEHRGLFGGASDITLLSVVPAWSMAYIADLSNLAIPPPTPEQIAQLEHTAFERAVASARKLIVGAGLNAIETRLVSNVPGDAIAAYARTERLDLLVMGSHGYGALKAVVLGSVATRVAAKCKTPLLVVRSRRRAR
jgi:nucleotide-binding universal stress UspA family protein